MTDAFGGGASHEFRLPQLLRVLMVAVPALQMAVGVGVVVYVAPGLGPLELLGLALFAAGFVAFGCWMILRFWRLGVVMEPGGVSIHGFSRRSPRRVARGEVAEMRFVPGTSDPKRLTLVLVKHDGEQVEVPTLGVTVGDGDGVVTEEARARAHQLAASLGAELVN